MPKPTLFILFIDLLAIAAAVTIYLTTGEEKLGEGSFLTHLSAIQLLAVSWISFQIFRIRNRGVASGRVLEECPLGMGADRGWFPVPLRR